MGKNLTVELCRNVLVVCITPRQADRTVDLAGVRHNVDYLVDHGVDFIMPECGTGLVYDATLAEYEAVLGAFVDAVGNQATVVPGIGPGFGRALEMGHIARSAGVDGVMIMPIVGPASATGVFQGLGEIVDDVQLPTILYQRRVDVMPVDHVVELCRHDGVVGLKYAVDDIQTFRRIAEGCGDGCAMICGMAEDPCIDYMAAGAVGFSSGMANFVPRMSLGILHGFASNDHIEASRLRQLMVPFEDLRGENGARYSGSALHAAMECAGLSGGPVIPFAEDVTEADLPQLRDMMKLLLAEERRLREEK